jgi:hypothetical protein
VPTSRGARATTGPRTAAVSERAAVQRGAPYDGQARPAGPYLSAHISLIKAAYPTRNCVLYVLCSAVWFLFVAATEAAGPETVACAGVGACCGCSRGARSQWGSTDVTACDPFCSAGRPGSSHFWDAPEPVLYSPPDSRDYW